MKLSILIPSMVIRRDMFTRLMYVLHPQLTKEVEILVDVDRGETHLGVKRQEMLEKAMGDYVCSIDDDDLVAATYIEDILNAIDQEPDAVGFNGEIKSLKNNKSCTFKMSMENSVWSRDKHGNFNRGIQHLSPVRRDIALKVGFSSVGNNEDQQYSEGINKLLETEVYINKILYKYLTRYSI